MSRRLTFGLRLALAVLAAVLLLAALVAWLNVRGESAIDRMPPAAPTAAVIERGAYLARAGNCIGCHTAAGGAPFAGGRAVETPFGAVMASNLTPDPRTGLGDWTAADFWRALHHGRSRDGRLLYPAFPYPSYTQVSRADADALFAYLRSLPAVEQPNRPHALRFPYGTQAALALWRALYFRPADFEPDAAQDAAWNRGKYLVQGLGHCAACHSSRDMLGGLNAEFAGGLMPAGGWYAPSLASPAEAGLQGWPREQAVRLLKTGMSAHAAVSGPMAEVVFASTQHLADADLEAMARYLATLPQREPPRPAFEAASADTLALGSRLYGQHCAACHGAQGEGAGGLYPALAGNRAVTLAVPNNLVQMIRRGGFPPTTAGNPRPFGMPPFGQVLSDAETAAVATYIRQSWGHAASEVTPLQVLQVR